MAIAELRRYFVAAAVPLQCLTHAHAGGHAARRWLCAAGAEDVGVVVVFAGRGCHVTDLEQSEYEVEVVWLVPVWPVGFGPAGTVEVGTNSERLDSVATQDRQA